jgi:hypothetical protein
MSRSVLPFSTRLPSVAAVVFALALALAGSAASASADPLPPSGLSQEIAFAPAFSAQLVKSGLTATATSGATQPILGRFEFPVIAYDSGQQNGALALSRVVTRGGIQFVRPGIGIPWGLRSLIYKAGAANGSLNGNSFIAGFTIFTNTPLFTVAGPPTDPRDRAINDAAAKEVLGIDPANTPYYRVLATEATADAIDLLSGRTMISRGGLFGYMALPSIDGPSASLSGWKTPSFLDRLLRVSRLGFARLRLAILLAAAAGALAAATGSPASADLAPPSSLHSTLAFSPTFAAALASAHVTATATSAATQPAPGRFVLPVVGYDFLATEYSLNLNRIVTRGGIQFARPGGIPFGIRSLIERVVGNPGGVNGDSFVNGFTVFTNTPLFSFELESPDQSVREAEDVVASKALGTDPAYPDYLGLITTNATAAGINLLAGRTVITPGEVFGWVITPSPYL